MSWVPRLLGLTAATLAAVTAAGCSLLPTGSSRAARTAAEAYPVEAEAWGARASLEVETGADGTEVHYTVANAGSEAVVVIDQLPRLSGIFSLRPEDIDPDRVVVGSIGDGTVRISKQSFRPSDDTEAPAPAQLAGTRVNPGARHSGSFRLPNPVEIAGPGYPTDEYTQDGIRSARAWQFCLGVVPNVATGSEDFAVLPVGQRDQVLLCSETADIPRGTEFVPHP